MWLSGRAHPKWGPGFNSQCMHVHTHTHAHAHMHMHTHIQTDEPMCDST